MSTEVNTAFVQQYVAQVERLSQQKGSRLMSAVRTRQYTGKAAKAVEQIGIVAPVRRTVRHADTPIISTPHDARWVFPEDYEWADFIDKQDDLRMLVDLQEPYSSNGADGLNRAIDDEIIGAFYGTSKTGENGTTNTSFTAGNQIASGSTGLSITKLRTAKKLLMAAEAFDPSDDAFVVLSAEQIDDLLNETQAISIDYNAVRPLVEGGITSFMGFTFIHSERLPVDGSSDRRVMCFLRSGMHLGRWGGFSARVDDRADKSYARQVYNAVTIGSTRIEESKCVEIKCTE